MFGTIAHLRPKQGKMQEVVTILEEWDRVRRPKAKGAVAGCLYRSEQNPDELMLVAMFQDRESYFANANDPEQDRWYQKLRGLLASDPKWEDGEIIGAWGSLETTTKPQTKERGK